MENMGVTMQTIKIKPVEMIGKCRAGITGDDEFQVTGMRLENPLQSNICLLATSFFPPTVKQLQRDHGFFAHVSCPDCVSSLETENRVTFLLGHADKWEYCKLASEYQNMCDGCPEEPELAQQLRLEASRYLELGAYVMAAEKMQDALDTLHGYTL